MILEKYLKPQFLEIDHNFVRMATAVVRGLKYFAPLHYSTTILLLKEICNIKDNHGNNNLYVSNRLSYILLFVFSIFTKNYEILKPFLNLNIRIVIYLNKYFLVASSRKYNLKFQFLSSSNYLYKFINLFLLCTILLGTYIVL